MTEMITISTAASAYIKQMLEKNPKAQGFRLSVKKTGCSGFSYISALAEEINSNDIAFKTQEGLPIFIDAQWLHLLQGIEIDYVEETKTGLKQKRLVYTNPQEKGRCGCGESFHME